MSSPLNEALSRQDKLAFRRVLPGANLIRRLHKLPDNLRHDDALQTLQSWLVVPFSLWPVDIIGLADHVGVH